MFKIIDAVALGDAQVTSAGYLEANARTARTGVQQYLGVELGRPDLAVVNVYRDEAEVFAKTSLDTFSKLPITNDHPAVDVDASNWKDLAVGTTGDEVLRDGEYLKIGLKITDGSAVSAIKGGKRELSVGYAAEIVWQDGVAPDGTPYQAVQKNIVANHIAIVDRGRAGSAARIGDAWGVTPVQDFQSGDTPKTVTKTGGQNMSLKTVVLGDKAVEVAEVGVAVVEQFKADSAKALADAQTTHDAAIAAKDEEIGQLKVDLKAAQDASNIDVDALVAARSELVGLVKTIDAKIDPKGKSDAELRKAAVAAKLGDAMVVNASDAEITGMFKAISKGVTTTNPVADAIQHGVQPVGDAATAMADAWRTGVNDMNAWRTEV